MDTDYNTAGAQLSAVHVALFFFGSMCHPGGDKVVTHKLLHICKYGPPLGFGCTAARGLPQLCTYKDFFEISQAQLSGYIIVFTDYNFSVWRIWQ